MTSIPKHKLVTPEKAPLRAQAGPIPARPKHNSSEVVNHGTNLTLYFLALESFLNRYPGLVFINQCIELLSARLIHLSETNPDLYAGLKSFASAMPLDAISTSAHPKKIKQALLETLLNPKVLNNQLLCTEPLTEKKPVLADIIRDLQFYCKLCDLSTDAVHARDALTQVVYLSTLCSDADKTEFKKIVEGFNFKYITDKTFCIAQKIPTNFNSNPKANTQSVNKEAKKKVALHDTALDAIILFRRYEQLSREIIAAAGETYESMQSRMLEQRKLLSSFKNECEQLSTSYREEIYKHITQCWKEFVHNDRSRADRQSRFLDFLANPT